MKEKELDEQEGEDEASGEAGKPDSTPPVPSEASERCREENRRDDGRRVGDPSVGEASR